MWRQIVSVLGWRPRVHELRTLALIPRLALKKLPKHSDRKVGGRRTDAQEKMPHEFPSLEWGCAAEHVDGAAALQSKMACLVESRGVQLGVEVGAEAGRRFH